MSPSPSSLKLSKFDRCFATDHTYDTQRDFQRHPKRHGGAYSQSCWSAVLSMALTGTRANPSVAAGGCRAGTQYMSVSSGASSFGGECSSCSSLSLSLVPAGVVPASQM